MFPPFSLECKLQAWILLVLLSLWSLPPDRGVPSLLRPQYNIYNSCSNSSTNSVFASYPRQYLHFLGALLSVGIEAFQFIEFFAGSRMATQCVAAAGYRATCIDIDDHVQAGYAIGEGTVFDILSPSGLVFPYCSMTD